jgi:hypothetical protein
MRAEISSTGAEMEETLKHRVQDVLMFLDRWTLGVRKELSGRIEHTRSDLKAVTMSLDHRIQAET